MSTQLGANAVNQREQDRDRSGRFGPSTAPESDLTVLPGGLRPALHDYESDETFHYPQANDLDKVVTYGKEAAAALAASGLGTCVTVNHTAAA
ncbi:hypothetical protein [Ornithinimicrobium murale]|uniref:hypothetical protein n=1 Tax=Ornithinimicrobium murale TaxID=1050153 RepID=UPI000E0D4BF3|nr:hypothetical protein [Ornithinimicrobium murale]